jgi:hypothetical protein
MLDTSRTSTASPTFALSFGQKKHGTDHAKAAVQTQNEHPSQLYGDRKALQKARLTGKGP